LIADLFNVERPVTAALGLRCEDAGVGQGIRADVNDETNGCAADDFTPS
jgi:hypothetical protein